MKSLVALMLLAIFSPCYSQVTNWCGLASCQDRVHVDCQMSSGAFASACPDSVVMLNLAPAQTSILNRMNTVRNQVAGGLLQNKFAAVRMGTLRWNSTLANLGRKNVKKCTFTQDQCVNTPQFDFVGQNIARSVAPLTDTRTNSQRILELIDFWFSENAATTMADIRRFPLITANSPQIANFCQLVRDYATWVGCGALTYNDTANNYILFTCNFDMANVLDYPVYVDGPVGRDCKTGRNPNYPYLCSTQEVYNVNSFWEDFQ